jgi:hypothetical protein
VDNGGRIVFGHGLDSWTCGKKAAKLRAKLRELECLDFRAVAADLWPSQMVLENALENLGSLSIVEWVKLTQVSGLPAIVETVFNHTWNGVVTSSTSFGRMSCRCCNWNEPLSSLRSQRNHIDIHCRIYGMGSVTFSDSRARQHGPVFSHSETRLSVSTQQNTVLHQAQFEVHPGQSMIGLNLHEISQEMANLHLASSYLSDTSHVHYFGTI